MALALTFGNENVTHAAVQALPKVARTASHLFQFVDYANGMRGWGRGMKRAVSNWYRQKGIRKGWEKHGLYKQPVIYQALKYRQRNGWTHRDLLRKAHPSIPELKRYLQST